MGDKDGLELCDICFQKDDKCNLCDHCDKLICQYCTKFYGPRKDFSCGWNSVDGVICSDCEEWKRKHYRLCRRSDWTRDPYASDESSSESEEEVDPDFDPNRNDD